MLTWDFPSSPPEADLSRIASEVITHGRTQAKGGNAQPIACLVREGKELVAGGCGRTEFNRLFIAYLWVSETRRRQGIGSEILRRLENQASDVGCTSALLETLNEGVGVTMYLGHSSSQEWTEAGLFDVAAAQSLTNPVPTLVVQFGCWNTYYVSPASDTLAQPLLLTDFGGAAASITA